MIEVFSKEWFEQNQVKLLKVANTWWGRRLFGVYGKYTDLGKNKISRIGDNFIEWPTGKPNQFTTEIRNYPMFAIRLHKYLKPVWWAVHYWDLGIANRFSTAWNLGFDTLTKYPSTVDSISGTVLRQVDGGIAFSNLRNGNGTDSFDLNTSSTMFVQLSSTTTPGAFGSLDRSIVLFNTSSIGVSATINTATLSLFKDLGFSALGNNSIDVVTSGPASNTTLSASDYQNGFNFSLAKWRQPYNIQDFLDGAYTPMPLNSTGISNINQTGITKSGLVLDWDYGGSGPTWVSNASSGLLFYNAADGSGNGPKLVITYTVWPTVTTQSATSVLRTTATANGNITNVGSGGVDERGIVYGTSSQAAPGNVAPTSSGYSSHITETGTYTTGAFTESITGLSASTTYYYRAYAHNANGAYVYGSEVSFTTIDFPTVTTSAVTNNSATLGSATGNGNVTASGGSTVTDAGIVYNTTGTPTTADTKVTGSATSGAFTASLTGLVPGTLYYVRAYAINAAGTVYGSQVTFTAVNFLNPSNAYSDGGTYCTAGGDTGAINVQLSGDGGTTWSSMISNTYTGSVTEQTFGNGTTELWGSSWLGSNVNNTNFRLRISCGTRTGFTHSWKTFGFAPGSTVVLTGIAVKVKGSWNSGTNVTSIGHISVEILYGSSTVPVAQGSMAYASDGGGGTGALEAYNGSGWNELVDTTSTQSITSKQLALGSNISKSLQDVSATVSNISLPAGHNFTINGGLTLGSGQGITYTTSSTLNYLPNPDYTSIWMPGDMKEVAYAQPDPGWLLCDGTAYSRATYATLFGRIGTTWGAGDGSTTFNVPDMRGRSPIGAGTGTAAGASAWTLGTRPTSGAGGEETHTLTSGESGLPAHSHALHGINGGSMGNGSTYPGLSDSTNRNPSGNGTPIDNSSAISASSGHNTVTPAAVVNFVIKY